jgi:hypothetical protein
MSFTLETALQEATDRQQRGHPAFYRSLPKEASEMVREHYRSRLRQMAISEHGCDDAIVLKNDCGTIIAKGYRRVVIGDYGAYVEFTKDQIVKDSVSPKWSGEQNKDASYIWYETTDAAKTKIYFQQHKVQYADYRTGMYYVSPDDVFIEQFISEASKEWREFRRIASPQHLLEAKRAAGGEAIGLSDHKIFAKTNQWICRNPSNGHVWSCNDNDFRLLYKLVTDDGTEPRSRKKPGKRRSNPGRKKLNEAAAETTTPAEGDCGPLFGDQ